MAPPHQQLIIIEYSSSGCFSSQAAHSSGQARRIASDFATSHAVEYVSTVEQSFIWTWFLARTREGMCAA